MTCIAEYLSWDSFTNEQKLSLSGLYVPYLALCKSISFHLASPRSDEGSQQQYPSKGEAIFQARTH